jgi:hypothetical protein
VSIWKVQQREIGYPHGECVRASYASLLRRPLESVPRLDPAHVASRGITQRDAEREWLDMLGLDLKIVPTKTMLPPRRYHMISTLVQSDTNQGILSHRVVGRGGKLVWDPHPGGSDFVGINHYIFLVRAR